MKRDMDLIRQLLALFAGDAPAPSDQPPHVAGYEPEFVKYHLLLMYQAGLLNCEPVNSETSDRVIYVIPFSLTWEGHEFYDTIRNDGTWQKIKDIALSKTDSLAFSVTSAIATNLALVELGLRSAK